MSADLTSAMQKASNRQGKNSIEMTAASPKLACKVKRSFKSNGASPKRRRKVM